MVSNPLKLIKGSNSNTAELFITNQGPLAVSLNSFVVVRAEIPSCKETCEKESYMPNYSLAHHSSTEKANNGGIFIFSYPEEMLQFSTVTNISRHKFALADTEGGIERRAYSCSGKHCSVS